MQVPRQHEYTGFWGFTGVTRSLKVTVFAAPAAKGRLTRKSSRGNLLCIQKELLHASFAQEIEIFFERSQARNFSPIIIPSTYTKFHIGVAQIPQIVVE